MENVSINIWYRGAWGSKIGLLGVYWWNDVLQLNERPLITYFHGFGFAESILEDFLDALFTTNEYSGG